MAPDPYGLTNSHRIVELRDRWDDALPEHLGRDPVRDRRFRMLAVTPLVLACEA